MRGREWHCQREGCDEHGIQTTSGRLRMWCSERCRKLARYFRPCIECGTPVDCTTPGKMPNPERPVCKGCAGEHYKTWTREAITEWIREHSSEGVAIGARDARRQSMAVYAAQREFGSWNAAVEAAGFTPRAVGERIDPEAWRAARWEWGRERRERMIAMWNDGESVHMIAREFGLTAHGVRQNLTDWRKRGEPVAYRRQPRVAAMAGGGS